MPLSDIPAGTNIHNIEITPGGGAKFVRSAGTSAQISGNDGIYSIIKLSSGEVRKVISAAKATVGTVSNLDQKNIKIGRSKALVPVCKMYSKFNGLILIFY